MSGGVKKSPIPSATSASFNAGGTNLATSRSQGGNITTNIPTNNPDYQQYTNAGSNVSGLLSGALGALNVTPEQRAQYVSDLYQPQADEINRVSDRALDDTVGKFNAQGGLNSTGFTRQAIGGVENNRLRALTDARAGANLESYDLPGRMAAPFLQGLDATSTVQGNAFNRMMSMTNPAFQGQQIAYNQGLSSSQAGRKSRGFISSLF